MGVLARAPWSAIACVALATGAAPAAEPPHEEQKEPAQAGFLLRIEGADAYFDLGRAAGAGPGDRVRVLRGVRALHPVTRQPVEDRFVIGELTILEAGAVLARARPEPELLRQLQIGDRLELQSEAGDPRQPMARVLSMTEEPSEKSGAKGCAPEASGQASAEATEALGFREAWLTAQGLPPAERLQHWSTWLTEHPATAVTAAVRREIDGLQREAERAAKPAAVALPSAQVTAPSRGFAGDPIEVVLNLAGAGPEPKAALLQWRPRGQPLFHAAAFARDDAQTWRARLPAAGAQQPGVDYFVEVVGAEGVEQPVSGDAAQPHTIDLARPPGADDGQRKQRSQTGLWVDFVDWNHLKGNDQHLNVEGEFLYRVLGPIHSVRMGFGVFQGYGESLSDALQDERSAGGGAVQYRKERVGYNYGFTELEVHPADWLGLATKLLSGVNRGGFLMGVSGSLRIGHEQGTSLLLSSGFTPGIGNRNELSLAWDQVAGFPMAASVIVSNEPVQADYGVRFVYQVGRRLTDYLDLSLRASYQLRDINHNGFGLGLAQTFHW